MGDGMCVLWGSLSFPFEPQRVLRHNKCEMYETSSPPSLICCSRFYFMFLVFELEVLDNDSSYLRLLVAVVFNSRHLQFRTVMGLHLMSKLALLGGEEFLPPA